MDDKIFDQVHDVDLEKTMKESYIEYAMSVIAVSYTHLARRRFASMDLR